MGKEDEKEQPKANDNKRSEPIAEGARNLAADECSDGVERLVTQLARNKWTKKIEKLP
jgi:hypothetical protein